jgi:hypothetical protein
MIVYFLLKKLYIFYVFVSKIIMNTTKRFGPRTFNILRILSKLWSQKKYQELVIS